MYLFTGKNKTVKITIVIIGYFIIEYMNRLLLDIKFRNNKILAENIPFKKGKLLFNCSLKDGL